MWGLLGFLGPWMGDLLGIGKTWLNGKQEYKLLKLQLEHSSKADALAAEREWDLETLKATVRSQASARKDRTPWGVQIMDAAAAAEDRVISRWMLNLAFLLYVFLDGAVGVVRPAVTFLVIGTWAAVEIMPVWQMLPNILDGFDQGEAFQLAGLWNDLETNVMLTVLSYWFGERTRRRVRAGQ